jgi:FkbM family methyltransferase
VKVSIDNKEFEVAAEPADFWRWVMQGRYDAEWAILKALLRPEHTFIDLGAWVGSHSLYASTIAHHHTYAVEPDPVAFEILKQNALGLPISICQGAITGHKGTVTLGSGFLGASTTRENPLAGGGIGAWEPGQQFEVLCTTLREFVADMPTGDFTRTFFIKMDVEGAEEEILKDVEFFEEHKPTVYLECHPFWWKNEPATWERIRKIGKLYERTLNLQMKPMDLNNSYPREVIWPS